LAQLQLLLLQIEDVKLIAPGSMRGMPQLALFCLRINQHWSKIVPVQEGLTEQEGISMAKGYIQNKINQSLHPDRTVDQFNLAIGFLKRNA
jgi:hypothetical protein